MAPKNSIGHALRQARGARKLSQEAFSDKSSRTYMSSLERGMKSPTLQKIDDLAEVLTCHPLTLLTLAYLGEPHADGDIQSLLTRVAKEVEEIIK